MNKIFIFIITVFTFFIISCEESEDKEIIIENPILRFCIINELHKDKDDVIYQSEAESLKYIRCSEKGIYSVKGIENFINLEYLKLSGADASGEFIEIAKLKNLKEFHLYHYSKPNSFLSSLQKLDILSLFPTYTSDLSSIENTNIKSLEIFYSGDKAPSSALNSIAKE